MGFQDRDYYPDRGAAGLDKGQVALQVLARAAADLALLLPAVSGAALIAAGAGWVDRSDPSTLALAAFFSALALSAIGSLVVLAERWLDTLPVKKLDHAAVAGLFVAVLAGVLHTLALRAIIYSVATVREGSPLAGLDEAIRPALGQTARWLCDPSSVVLVAMPVGVVAAVRGDEEDRPLRRQVWLTAAISSAASVVLAYALWLLRPARTPAPSWGALLFLGLVVPPLLGALLAVAARLGESLERRLRVALRLDDA